jgi:hypothetical protein
VVPIIISIIAVGVSVGALIVSIFSLRIALNKERREGAKHLQEQADRAEAARRAAAGTLDVAVDFQHDCGATVFAKITARNTRVTDDEINAVVLESHPTTEWKVLVPDLAPAVPIQAKDLPSWTHSFPLQVPAEKTLTFWISGYADMGVKEHQADAVLGKVFVFNVRSRSGDVKRDTKLRRKA